MDNLLKTIDLNAMTSQIDQEFERKKQHAITEALNTRYDQELRRLLKDKNIRNFNDVVNAIGSSEDDVSKGFLTFVFTRPFETFMKSGSPTKVLTSSNVNITNDQVLAVLASSSEALGVFDIAKALSTTLKTDVTTEDIKEVVSFLRETKQVSTEGQRRGTKYKITQEVASDPETISF